MKNLKKNTLFAVDSFHEFTQGSLALILNSSIYVYADKDYLSINSFSALNNPQIKSAAGYFVAGALIFGISMATLAAYKPKDELDQSTKPDFSNFLLHTKNGSVNGLARLSNLLTSAIFMQCLLKMGFVAAIKSQSADIISLITSPSSAPLYTKILGLQICAVALAMLAHRCLDEPGQNNIKQ